MQRVFPYLYLLRVCILGAVALTLLPIYAADTSSGLHNMFGGLFDLTFWGTFWATLAGLMTSVALGVAGLMVFHAGCVRAGVPPVTGWLAAISPLKGLGWDQLANFVPVVGVVSLVPFASLMIGIFRVSESFWKTALPALLGCVVFLVAFLGTMILSVRVSWKWLLGLVSRLLYFSPAGYLDKNRRLLDGHGFAISMTALFLFLYAVCGVSTWVRLVRPDIGYQWWFPNPPPLAFLLLLVGLMVWVGGAVTFFFDRFRVPVIVLFGLYVFLVSQTQQADQYYDIHKFEAQGLTPAEVVAPAGATPVIVAASGGGIQSEAWTVKVLAELDRATEGKFGRSVRLISAVSGGAVGALDFVASYKNKAPDLACAWEDAIDTSLYASSWGLVYPDLIRTLLPPIVPKQWTRGWALERVWNRKTHPARLSDWREDVRQGNRPALLLNATIVESGERLAFPSFDFGEATLWKSAAPRTFYDLYQRRLDVAPVTAARLSASFPYVTGAARADADLAQSERYHIVDGGYYDNYGISTAVNFLDRAFAGQGGERKVMLVEIRDSRDGRRAAKEGQGWFYQFTAPLNALLNVRSTAQRERNNSSVALLKDALRSHGVTLHHAEFENPRGSVPLSWHLTKSEIQLYKNDWKDYFEAGAARGAEADRVAAFLGVARTMAASEEFGKCQK